MVVLRYCIFALLIAIGSVSVEAQDKKQFSGVYLGVEGGFLDVGTDNGLAYGVFLGYRYQTNGNLVLGTEFSVLGQNGSGDNQPDGDGAILSWLGTVGFATGEENKTLYTIGAGAINGFDIDNSGGFFNSNDGFVILAGYERALGSGFVVRLRGQYIDFGEGLNGYTATVGLLFNF
ncbi:MAG: outer membrane beta-barrel protein [Kordiimonadaceae bacterium]|nr:outer membrane beta-barrel protein [Kordiimonadaceae bacterium]